MKKDIQPPKVEDIAMAVVREKDELNNDEWTVYLINLKNVKLEGTLVSSKGYGKKEDREVKTSVLRHFLDEVAAKSYHKVEQIIEDVFSLSNEYWVSFWVDGKMYDKKYVFLPETIQESNFTTVPLLEARGVMIR